ncbi:suppressor of fused domain protein [Bacilliculturomica massiliensis]|uniref:suppressor of fused domain protein n=1 Tax=Bacilliculturomica massiliensis TaxID=1917867 RepID=UPI001FE2DA4F|nr:suppressor of fused domain protein [Bacilliculturomica massiliensis]
MKDDWEKRNETVLDPKRELDEMESGKAVKTEGWEAITQAFERIYPEQNNPLHFGTLISWMLGGPDPLDGISVYDGGDFWHFVTYGFSELYDKESEDPERSGYGFELTVKLKKSPEAMNAACEKGAEHGPGPGRYVPEGDDEIRGMAGILQALGRYVFENGAVLRPFEYIYTGQENGMDPQGASKITGFITVADEAGSIRTSNGKVEFVQLIGATDRELKAVMDGNVSVAELTRLLGGTVTDYLRGDVTG